MEQSQGKFYSCHVCVGLKVLTVTHKPLGCTMLALHRNLYIFQNLVIHQNLIQKCDVLRKLYVFLITYYKRFHPESPFYEKMTIKRIILLESFVIFGSFEYDCTQIVKEIIAHLLPFKLLDLDYKCKRYGFW